MREEGLLRLVLIKPEENESEAEILMNASGADI